MQNAQSAYLSTISALLEDNEIEKALEALRQLDEKTGADIWKDLTMLYGNFRSSSKAQREGRISFDEYRRYEAQTRYGVLELMKEIPRRIELNAKIRSVDTFQFSVPDEVKLEKVLGPQSNILRINWLEKALKASKSVCRVVCADGNLGTGFLTKEGYIFTNNHVLPTAETARTARIEFNYELDAGGSVKSRTSYQLDATDFKTSTPDQLDFTQVKVLDRPDVPLSTWGYAEFDPEAIPSPGEAVTIIQHPKGQDKQIALNANEVLGQLNQYLFYTTDTEPGSSGSPVYNSDWKVVAIHHAGKTDAEGGMTINAQGDKRGANRGILFRDIIAHLGGKPLATPLATPLTAGKESTTPTPPPIAQPTPAPQPAAPVPDPKLPPKFLIVYDLADDAAAKALNRHLNILKVTKRMRVHNVHEALPGEDPIARTRKELQDTDWIVVLVSVNLLNSPDWFGLVFDALEAKRKIIPIRVSQADLEGTGLEKLRSLPNKGLALSDFSLPDDAYAEIVAELKKLLTVTG